MDAGVGVYAVAVGALLLAPILLILLLAKCPRTLLPSARHRPRARAAAVPVRSMPGGRLHVLLVCSRNQPDHRVFPGGGIEPGETPADAAQRECIEEAGALGKLGVLLGTLRDARPRTLHAVTTVYVVHVEEELDEYEEYWRGRDWFDLGVPGSTESAECLARMRAALSPKGVHQRTLDLLEAASASVLNDCEQLELAARAGRSSGAALTPLRRRLASGH